MKLNNTYRNTLIFLCIYMLLGVLLILKIDTIYVLLYIMTMLFVLLLYASIKLRNNSVIEDSPTTIKIIKSNIKYDLTYSEWLFYLKNINKN